VLFVTAQVQNQPRCLQTFIGWTDAQWCIYAMKEAQSKMKEHTALMWENLDGCHRRNIKYIEELPHKITHPVLFNWNKM
jgi:hypothetical protein